ncbi:DUF4256 domain-containing protein [Virgibacillus sp. L01]
MFYDYRYGRVVVYHNGASSYYQPEVSVAR